MFFGCWPFHWQHQTSQERFKSAAYRRLKNSKRTSKCQSILFYNTWKTQKSWTELVRQGGRFGIFHPLCRSSQNKTGTSKVGAIFKAQEAQSFLNMLRTYSWKALKTLSRHPKCLFHARYDWKITVSRLGTKLENFLKNFFLKKTSKMSHSAEKWKGGTLWDSLTYILLQNIKKLEGETLLRP